MVTVGILQPGYLPWLGFFEQLAKSDVFILYDDVQYDKNGWRNRNRIKTANGVQWLTVPVFSSLTKKTLVNETLIDNASNWKRKHLLSIKTAYSKAPYFKNYFSIFEEAYSKDWNLLIDIDIFLLKKLAAEFSIDFAKVKLSSTMDVKGDRLSRLLGICKKVGADVFYEGMAGQSYIDIDYFAVNGVKIEFQQYRHPEYGQLHGEFIPYLSAIDLLFNYGKESADILLGN